MNKKLIQKICMLLLLSIMSSSISIASTTDITYTNPTLALYNGSVSISNTLGFISAIQDSNIPTELFRSWSCSFDAVPTIAYIGDNCFCIDTQAGTETNDGFGYGNILQCLRENPEVRVVHTDLSVDRIFAVLNLVYENRTPVALAPVSISPLVISRNDTVTCQTAPSGFTQLYTFYRERPFGVLYRGYASSITLDQSRITIRSGDVLRCQVQAFDAQEFVGYRSSDNTAVVNNHRVGAHRVHIAPAHPRVGEQMFCYGWPYVDTTLSVRQTFKFYNEDKILLSEVIVNSTGPTKAAYTPTARGPVSCVYEVSSGADVDSKEADTFVKLPRPLRPILTVSLN